MKKLQPFILLLMILLAGCFINANAQMREVVIPGFDPVAGGNIDDFHDVIQKALEADAPNRATDPNVVYILKRGQIYPSATTIQNTFVLRLKAEDGDGLLPALVQTPSSPGGTNYKRHLEAQEDVYFENIQFENQQADGGITTRSQRLSANGIRAVFKGCVFYQDGGGAICAWADSQKVYVYDCFAHSIGRLGENNSNGRFVDTRMDNYCDTVIIQNCTADVLNGAFFRAGSAITGYLKIDHCTTFNNRDANISIYRAKEAIVTNNLMMNASMLGETPYREFPDPDPDNFHQTTIGIDTIWDPAKITVRNNNIFYTDDVKEMWLRHDSIIEPLRVHPKIMKLMGADSVKAAFSEVITFKTTCPPPIAYAEATYVTPDAGTFPGQLCLGATGGLFPDQVDASYETTSASYTAGDDGYPLGDLNWFPEMKAKWENGDVIISGLNNRVTDLFKVYPNPAKDKLFFSTADQRGANIILYDILGKELQSMISNGGDIEVNVSQFPKGMYIYRVADSNGQTIQSGKVLIAK